MPTNAEVCGPICQDVKVIKGSLEKKEETSKG